VFEPPKNPVIFLMCNPSTADELSPDPTVRRCIGYAQAWGHSDLLVANIFALRSTDPDELLRADDPVGPENDAVLASLPPDAPIVCGWGTHKATKKRGEVVAAILRRHPLRTRDLLCLKMNADNSPAHPLYLPASLTQKPWRPLT
jgi:hypothetical protein